MARTAIGIENCTISFENNLIRTRAPNATTEIEWGGTRLAEDQTSFCSCSFSYSAQRACSIEPANELLSMLQLRTHPGTQ